MGIEEVSQHLTTQAAGGKFIFACTAFAGVR
jgi:hypothetical protein